MTKFKMQAINEAVSAVAAELNCTLIEAATKMQATAARQGKDELLDDLCEYKNALIDFTI